MVSKAMNRRLTYGLVAVTGLVAALLVGPAFASGGGALHDVANNDISNIPSLQRRAGNFVSYCSGCHSAKYVRYNHLARYLPAVEDPVVRTLRLA